MLTPEDVEALHPCGDVCDLCVGELPEIVEQIVARHVTAALDAAAEANEALAAERLAERAHGATIATLPDAARIVRATNP